MRAEKSEQKTKKIKKAIKISALTLLVLAILGSGYFTWNKYYKKTSTEGDKKVENNENINNQIAIIETNQGVIKIELFKSEAPKTVENFVKLANEGFYNGVKFHRVIKDFMIQGGDPLSKDESKKDLWGTGDPGYKFDDEPVNRDYKRGIVAMANSGPNTNGSQFFIMHQDNLSLPKSYTIFGNVIEGIEIVDKIANTQTNEKDQPLENMTIEKITIETKEEKIEAPILNQIQSEAQSSGQPVQMEVRDENGNIIDVGNIVTE
uniref:Peptidyl-prolyl cis-trans isomerase n=1 Tax=candidate division CPR3 bacterium TaxID=2268181 RepID=A0A7C4M2T6_UNCC3